MLEVFKIVVLCLICIILTAFFSTIIFTTLLFIILTSLFYDFDFETTLERHAINKVKHAYLKVRNILHTVNPSLNNSSRFIYSLNMSNINKPTMEFDLSRFNRSGSVYSPISKIGANSTSVARRLQPTQTSTPLTRNSPWQKNSAASVKAMTFQNSTVHRSPRYSLSTSSIPTPKNNSSSTSAIQTNAGPLLASTRFNINLGTYTDTKSPGLASRVVQYHNESQASQSQTHQAKYGSPGQFPIVQLYKKELPLLTRIPRRCTVRIAPPDSVAYNSTEANTILRESFIQPNTEGAHQGDTEINTKSVLDALKEISRKRIHSNDDLDDISKRQRKGSVSNVSTSTDNTNKDGKRLREDTPPKPKGTPLSPGTSVPKKMCVTNEIECSLSSSILMRLQGQKRKAAVGSLTNANKQRRIGDDEELVSRQTQTNLETTNTIPVTNSTQTTFTESMNGDSVPKEKHTSEAQTEDKDYKGLQTILQNARRKKKEFHEKTVKEIDAERASVRFDDPQLYKPLFNSDPLDIMRKNRLEYTMAAFNGDKPEIIPLPQLTLTQMKENFLSQNSPKQTTEAKNPPSILSPKNKTKHDKHVTFDIPNTNGDSSTNGDFGVLTTTSLATVAFKLSYSNASDLPPTTTAPTVVPTPQNSPVSFASSTSQTPFSDSSFNFSSAEARTSPFSLASTTPKTSPPSFGAITTTTVSNNTIATPAVNDTTQPSSSINFGSTQNTVSFSGGFGGANVMKSPAFGGLAPSTAVSTSNTTSVTNTAASTTGLSASVGFGFSASNTGAPATFMATPAKSTAPPAFPTTAAPSANNQPSLSFGGTQPVVAFGATSQPAATTAPPSFGSTASSQSTIAFGAPSTNNTTSTTNSGLFGFGAKTETSQPAPSKAFSFGGSKPNVTSPSKTGGFKFDLGKSPAPAAAATTAATSQNTSSVFGDSNLNKTGAFAFGGTSNTTTAPPAFGTQTAPPAFGTPKTTESTSGGFGVFGAPATQNSTFGATTTQSTTFGAPTTQSSAFGTPATQSSAFGAPTTQNTTFGATTTQNSAFGTPTTQSSAFGTPTTQSSAFGAPTTQSSAFGTPTTQSSTFGATTTQSSTFGAATTQSSSFGSFNTPTTTQNTPGFGFGATQAPKTTNTFATPTTTSAFNFGGSNAASKPFTFNAATTTANTSNVFGNSSTTFGNPAPSGGVFGAPTTTASITPSGSGVFGTPSTTTSTNVFGAPAATTTAGIFGASNTATTTASNAFGQTSGGVFGATTSGFGSAPVNGTSFGAQNNTFGSTTATPNAFGAAPNQAPFGTGATPTQGGVFGGMTNSQTNRPSTFGTTGNTSFGGGFGATTSTQPAAPSGFGTNTAAAPATGMFGGTSNPTPATGTFGATNPPAATSGFGAFGAPTSQPPAQQSGIFAFGNAPAAAPAASSGAYNFGGASTPAKPAAFNFSGGATTGFGASPAPAPSFGATPAPAPGFGATPAPAPGFGATPAPGFGTPTPSGMFSIGSGSTAPKQRTIIKARRRNN